MTRILEKSVSKPNTTATTTATGSTAGNHHNKDRNPDGPGGENSADTGGPDRTDGPTAAESLMDRITEEKVEISLLEIEYGTVIDELRYVYIYSVYRGSMCIRCAL